MAIVPIISTKNLYTSDALAQDSGSEVIVNTGGSWVLPEVTCIDCYRCWCDLMGYYICCDLMIYCHVSSPPSGGGTIISNPPLPPSDPYNPGGGGTPPSTSYNYCNCCGQNNCVCYNTTLKITDANNSSRFVNQGGTLVMVANGNARAATMTVANLGFTPASGYPLWDGPGISGTGYSITRSFSSVGAVGVKCGLNCPSLAGAVNIVSENRLSLSYKIKDVEDKINQVGSAVKSGLGALGQLQTSGPIWNASLTGEIYQKNVDKYMDGSAYDYYYSLSLNGSITGKMPTLKIWVCNYGLAKVYGFLDLGNISTGVTLEGVKDPSKANQYSCNGNLCLSSNSAELGVKGMVGVEDKICATIKAQATLSKFEVCDGFTIESSGIYSNPKIEYSDVVAQIKLEGNFLNNIECSLFDWSAPIIESGSIPLGRKLIYSF